jgi:Fe-S-cluster containining protein
MSTIQTSSGPLAGESEPVHGGSPGAAGCDGCTDCCHLPEISVTDEEVSILRALAADRPELNTSPLFTIDPLHEGWQIMQGPCAFRDSASPVHSGGCRIYGDRPAGCRIFTCKLLLELRAVTR